MKCEYIFKKGIGKNKKCEKESNKKYCKIHDKYNKKELVKTENDLPKSTLELKKIEIKNYQEEINQKILNLNTTDENKSNIMKNFLNIKKLDINSSEYYKTKVYIDQSLSIPFSNCYNIREYIGININLDLFLLKDKILIKNFIEKIKNEFDKNIYGMENVKNEIINYICKFISNPHSQQNNIALHGSAGVCKTKFIEVLSTVLNIPFKIISLGGMKDTNYLLGHSQTYQDSKCGIIVQSIIESKIMNPILYFDELDKVSNGEHGQDIHSVLSNITDPSINKNFKDRYFSNLLLDLSKVFYVFTFNDITKVNKILLDRLNVIHVENPSKNDKIIILRDYCLRDILKNIGIIIIITFDDNCYQKIIEYTETQIDNKISSGIRESSRILEKILLEINKEILLNISNRDNIDIHINLIEFTEYFNKLQYQFIYIDNLPLLSHMYI
jgi:ATP-dependent Lon protease